MSFFETLQPGKRENSFYMKNLKEDNYRTGLQDISKDGEYLGYVWDPQTRKHIVKCIKLEK